MIDMKKIKIIITFIFLGLSVVSHFMYERYPNYLFSILFPVNESIWEHMKLIITSVILASILEYFIYRKKDIKINNFILAYGISIPIGIISYLVVYLPLEIIFGHSLFLAVTILFLVFGFISFISYHIMTYRKIRYGNLSGWILIILLYFLFYIWTYYPPINKLFLDTQKNGYGIMK